jgi:serine/threonine protein kinase
MTSDNVQALPLGTQLGDYRLDAIIGHGGFGITYRAFDGQLAKVVAIKEYLPIEFAVRRADGQVVPRGARYADDFAWGRERFLDEARALARFRHPHIVPVLRFLEANGTAYTVMEFEDGQSVAQWLQRTQSVQQGRRLPPPDVLRLAAGLLNGLGAVHAQGFLHRDIKPSNIIVRRDGVPILIDFGAARQAMGGRTRTLTSVLTPQYAPIEQYALDSKQGPWSDIYSAAAVLHHAVAGQPPPEAAARVGHDPYKPLEITQADRYDQKFLAAIDRALAFAPDQRPPSVEVWREMFGASLDPPDNTPTRRMASPATSAGQPITTPRLGGARRGEEVAVAAPSPQPSRFPTRLLALIVVAVLVAAGLWAAKPTFEKMMAAVPVSAPTATPAPTPLPPPTAIASKPATPAPSPAPSPSRSPVPQTSTPAAAPSAAEPAPADKELLAQTQHAAEEARGVYEKAMDTAAAARTMAGEARIVAVRAAQATLENAQRLTSDDGASYVGQVADGKRQGLGVIEAKDGDRRAGEWQGDLMDGRGTERLPDGARYEGQWRDDRQTGLGVMEKPGVERDEGNFIAGKIEGLGLHRILAEPVVVQIGDWHNDALDGPGVETVGDRERYEGMFRAGKRHGFGQVTGADKKVTSGRWEDGKLVESSP